ncbi:hypothetical protein J5N97_003838 [Dioscorea zingiberensis]|uniref:Uncharacterized protein n=1 Tax=Dioscorea zingiberensis TaxID=325984 RepID=A0A9D5D6V7_9LILI|nr:hypothetical protein J5N97_003838 [Dioscorea zingiberensis]
MGGEKAEPVNNPMIFDGEDEKEVLEIGEEVLEGVMRWLEEEIIRPSSPSYYQEAAFVTINGNEESCGPSFSASASTVMASIDTRGCAHSAAAYFFGVPAVADAGKGPWPIVSAVDGGFWPMPESDRTVVKEADGEDDDTWLAGVLGAPVFEIEEMLF